MFIDGVLIPAGVLVNKVSVLQEEVREVHYLHIKLFGHAIVRAEGPELRVCLDVVVNCGIVGQVLACSYREDLAAACLGSGHHSFAWHLPTPLAPAERHVIEVRRSADGQALNDSPWVLPARLCAAA